MWVRGCKIKNTYRLTYEEADEIDDVVEDIMENSNISKQINEISQFIINITVIDVNTGKCVSKKKDEETYLKINIEAAKEVLKSWGLLAVEGLFARNQYFNFAGVDEERLTDLQNAINDPNIKDIMCSRGGYGLMKIIDQIDLKPLRRNPKWIIGFSDITALHNALSKKGICSIHGSMCKHLFESELNKESIPILQKILLEKVYV